MLRCFWSAGSYVARLARLALKARCQNCVCVGFTGSVRNSWVMQKSGLSSSDTFTRRRRTHLCLSVSPRLACAAACHNLLALHLFAPAHVTSPHPSAGLGSVPVPVELTGNPQHEFCSVPSMSAVIAVVQQPCSGPTEFLFLCRNGSTKVLH